MEIAEGMVRGGYSAVFFISRAAAQIFWGRVSEWTAILGRQIW